MRERLRLACWLLRLLLVACLLGLAGWGVCLGALVSTVATLLLAAVALLGRGRRAGCLGMSLAFAVLLAGLVEVPLATHRLGAIAREGPLTPRQQAAVAGINVLLAGAATAMGFVDFGRETLTMMAPARLADRCPPERMSAYGKKGRAPLHRWRSDLPMRSERFRGQVRRWVAQLPAEAPEGTERPLGPTGPFTWKTSAYFAADEANRVPVALNAPTTTMEGVAVREGSRWRLELLVHLFVQYPERATLAVGPLTLEEGLFYDAPLFLRPYCGEYRFERYSDDPSLERTEPIRGPFERVTTALLRAAGAGYR